MVKKYKKDIRKRPASKHFNPFDGFFCWFNLALIQVKIPLEDSLLCALLAGVIIGKGSEISLGALGPSGGTDILSVIFCQHFSIQPGTTRLAFNVIILSTSVLLLTIEIVLYSLIHLYISS